MANYATLKASVNNVITTNANNEITGALLNQLLNAIIDSLGVGYQFMGLATPSTNPGTPDQRVFYIAKENGTYANFNGIVVENEVVFLTYDTAWSKVDSGLALLDSIMLEGENLFTVTMTHGFYNASGVATTNNAYDSCQLTMTPGRRYRIYPQLRTSSGAPQPATRVFRENNGSYTQVWYKIQGGGVIEYTCPNDGYTYMLQLAKPLYPDTTGTPAIRELLPVSEVVEGLLPVIESSVAQLSENTENIATINDELHAPDLWEVTTVGSFYNASGVLTTNASYDGCQIYNLPNGHTYRIQMQTVSSGAGNYVRVYRVNGTTLTQVYARQQNGGTIDYTVPMDGNSYMLQTVMRKQTGDGPAPMIFDMEDDMIMQMAEIYERMKDYRKIKILSIGNSYSRDAFMYFPFLLENMMPGVEITFGILYQGGCTLQMHYNFISQGTNYNSFDFYHTGDGWTSTATKNIDYALGIAEWDIILLQQRSYSSNNYSTYQPYLNNIVTLLQSKVTYNFRLGWLLTPALNDNSPELVEESSAAMFENIVAAVQKMMDETAVEFVIPCGTAIQNARTTALNSLGDTGGLMYDNLHLQEGLPCLIESYVVAIVIAQLMGKPNSVFGDQIRPTAEWISAHNIIQQHGTSVGVTEANCYIAQKCAAIAVKKPYEITDLTALNIV